MVLEISRSSSINKIVLSPGMTIPHACVRGGPLLAPSYDCPLTFSSPLERVEHQPRQQLGIKIRALGWHFLELRGDRLHLIDARRRNEASQVTRFLRHRLGRLFEQVHIFE